MILGRMRRVVTIRLVPLGTSIVIVILKVILKVIVMIAPGM